MRFILYHCYYYYDKALIPPLHLVIELGEKLFEGETGIVIIILIAVRN